MKKSEQSNFILGPNVNISKLLLVEVSVRLAQHTQDQMIKKLNASMMLVLIMKHSWLMEHAQNASHTPNQDQKVEVVYTQHVERMEEEKRSVMMEIACNAQITKEALISQLNVRNHLVEQVKDLQETLNV
jgi:hypothetical protein